MRGGRGFNKRGLYLITIGVLVMLFAYLYMTQDILETMNNNGTLIIKPGQINYTSINVRTGSNISYSISYNQSMRPGLIRLYLAYAENPYIPVQFLNNTINGYAYNIRRPGKYFLVFENRGNSTILANYTVNVTFHRVIEKFNSATSIAGILIIIAGLLLLYNDVVSYFSAKYPDIIQRPGIKCSSLTLNKHVCTVQTMYDDFEEAKKGVQRYMEGLGYRVRKDVGLGLIMERSRINPFSKEKPVLVTIDFYNLPIISITYTIPRSRAAGSIDLAWIFKEASGLVKHGRGEGED